MVDGNAIAMWDGFVYIGKAYIYVHGLFNNSVCEFMESMYDASFSIAITHYCVL